MYWLEDGEFEHEPDGSRQFDFYHDLIARKLAPVSERVTCDELNDALQKHRFSLVYFNGFHGD